MLDLEVEIGFARPSEAGEIARLSREYIEFGLGWRYTPERIAAALRNPIKNVIVARQGGRLVGFGIMTYREESANLDLLAVKREFRRRGVARRLVRWLVDVAVAAGMENVYVQVRQRNSGAMAFYNRLGFYQIEELPGYYRGREAGVIFCKPLRPVFVVT